MKPRLISKAKLVNIMKGPDGIIAYSCLRCPVKSKDKEKMEMHLCFHYNEYRYLCGICGTGLKRKEHLDRHTLGHQEIRPHICIDCGKAFKRKEHLNIHMSRHTGERSQICPLCEKSFYRKDHLQKHMQIHTKNGQISAIDDDEEYQGDNYGYQDVSEISGHWMDVSELKDCCEVELEVMEQDSERPYVCCVCKKTYKRKDHLKMHAISHMIKEKVCGECGKGFPNEDQLSIHMNVHLRCQSELDEEEPDADIYAGGLLIPRTMSKKSKSDRPHECTLCGKRFKRKQHLKVHNNVHLKYPDSFWCSSCNKSYSSDKQFNTHKCTALIDNDSRSMSEERSPQPPLEAKKENNLPDDDPVEVIEEEVTEDSQIRIMHNEYDLPVPQRVFVCKYCGKSFKRKDHYKIHLHIHTGVKSFFCEDCGKGFYRKDHLKKHSQVHIKWRPKPKKALPDLYPINMAPKVQMTERVDDEVKPEITIHAPSNTKLRVPLQIKVPYQMVVLMDNGEKRAVTIDQNIPIFIALKILASYIFQHFF